MMRIIFFIVLTCETMICSGQIMKIEDRNRKIRAGFENSIGFTLDRKFDSLHLRASQGAAKWEKNIIYLIPATSGQDTLFAQFYFKKNLIHSDTVSFNVIKPEVFPSFGGDLLQKRELSFIKAIGGVIFFIRVNDFHWEPVAIKSYRFSVIRKNNFLFSTVEYSNRYSNDLKVKLDTMMSGDKILITDIVLVPGNYDFASCLPGVFEIE